MAKIIPLKQFHQLVESCMKFHNLPWKLAEARIRREVVGANTVEGDGVKLNESMSDLREIVGAKRAEAIMDKVQADSFSWETMLDALSKARR